MMPSIYKTFSLLALTALAAATPCQEKKTSRAEARAEARADAGGSGDKRSSHSVTHRVVVVNGKKIVDERTENGRPVGSGRVGSGRPPLPGKPAVPDADELLRRMREQLERDPEWTLQKEMLKRQAPELAAELERQRQQVLNKASVGMRCEVQPGGRRGVIRFIGQVPELCAGSSTWLGIEYDEPVGKNNGCVQGRRVFNCRGSNYGGFAKPENVSVGEHFTPELADELDFSEDEEL